MPNYALLYIKKKLNCFVANAFLKETISRENTVLKICLLEASTMDREQVYKLTQFYTLFCIFLRYAILFNTEEDWCM